MRLRRRLRKGTKYGNRGDPHLAESEVVSLLDGGGRGDANGGGPNHDGPSTDNTHAADRNLCTDG